MGSVLKSEVQQEFYSRDIVWFQITFRYLFNLVYTRVTTSVSGCLLFQIKLRYVSKWNKEILDNLAPHHSMSARYRIPGVATFSPHTVGFLDSTTGILSNSVYLNHDIPLQTKNERREQKNWEKVWMMLSSNEVVVFIIFTQKWRATPGCSSAPASHFDIFTEKV